MKTKQNPADLLVAILKGQIPEDYYATNCLMVNMADPYGNSPEMVSVSPSREIYKACRLAGTLDALKQRTRELYNTFKPTLPGCYLSRSIDGCTIYFRPDDTLAEPV